MKAIEFNHVGKQYRLGVVSTGTFSHDLNRWWTMNVRGKEDPYLKIGETNVRSKKGESDFVWALKDIDFKVKQGDVLGIIGKNGAMLKKISTYARQDIERFFDCKVFLQTWIKVKEDWRNRAQLVQNFGYDERNFD